MGRCAATLLLVFLAGCDVAANLFPDVPAGGRLLIVTVENHSPQPATLVVAAENPGVSDAAGTATPNSVPPMSTGEVRFGIPPGSGWAIFVNPGPNTGPLILAQDIPPNASGRMPFTILVGSNGSPSASVPGSAGPGWFGN